MQKLLKGKMAKRKIFKVEMEAVLNQAHLKKKKMKAFVSLLMGFSLYTFRLIILLFWFAHSLKSLQQSGHHLVSEQGWLLATLF